MKLGKVSVRDGFHVKKQDARLIAVEVQKIIDKEGACNPARLLKTASRANSKIHHCFEWDDAKAAALQRMERARYLVQAIEVEVITNGNGKKSVTLRAFQHVKIDEEPCYVSVSRVMGDEDLRRQVMTAALSSARSWLREYRSLEFLAPVAAGMSEAVDTIEAELEDAEHKLAATA